MKAPFDVGLPLVLRLLLPGSALSLTLLPTAELALKILGVPFEWKTYFVALLLACSLPFMVLEPAIFMLVTGRRFWLPELRGLAVMNQQARLERLLLQAGQEGRLSRQVELDLMTAEFPLDRNTGCPKAIYPTRLGNLFASYETYPTIKYGLDGVFFWPRLLIMLDKDIRSEIDTAQAVADGALNTAFALFVGSGFALLNILTAHNIAWIYASVACLLSSVFFYKVALPNYAQFGMLFCAAFDQYHDKFVFKELLDDLDMHMGDIRSPPRSARETNRAAWRFLRWHRYRKSSANDGPNVNVTCW